MTLIPKHTNSHPLGRIRRNHRTGHVIFVFRRYEEISEAYYEEISEAYFNKECQTEAVLTSNTNIYILLQPHGLQQTGPYRRH